MSALEISIIVQLNFHLSKFNPLPFPKPISMDTNYSRKCWRKIPIVFMNYIHLEEVGEKEEKTNTSHKMFWIISSKLQQKWNNTISEIFFASYIHGGIPFFWLTYTQVGNLVVRIFLEEEFVQKLLSSPDWGINICWWINLNSIFFFRFVFRFLKVAFVSLLLYYQFEKVVLQDKALSCSIYIRWILELEEVKLRNEYMLGQNK